VLIGQFILKYIKVLMERTTEENAVNAVETKFPKVEPHDVHLPTEVWTVIFQYLRNSYSFYSLYRLTKELHRFPWKGKLDQVQFRMNPNMVDLEHCDFFMFRL
jgi:hypothetical protein